MNGLYLWDVLTSALPCPARPTPSVRPESPAKTNPAVLQKATDDFEDAMDCYQSELTAYHTWIDVDACATAVLVASMEFGASLIPLDQRFAALASVVRVSALTWSTLDFTIFRHVFVSN
ncbi:hypothetical protein QQ045_005324 [Rhodiola kirilowii]